MSSVARQVPARSGVEESRSALSGEFVLGSLLALVAAFLIWREVEPLVLFRPVDAVVLSSETYKATRYTGRGRSRTYVAGRVFYRYELKGEQFVGFQYRRTNLFGSPEVASQYSRRDRVRVWYNPLNRADAVITRQPEWLLLAPSVLLLLLWVRMDYVARTRRRMREAAEQHYGRSFIS